MSECNYTGNNTKNYFTAYLQKCIQWKRQRYLKKEESINIKEKALEEISQTKYGMTLEEMVELRYREALLLKEHDREYPKWNELSNQRLITALLLLREDERKLIYQHVFEEKDFKEMGYLNNLPDRCVKAIYYYAIRKIRKWMGGN